MKRIQTYSMALALMLPFLFSSCMVLEQDESLAAGLWSETNAPDYYRDSDYYPGTEKYGELEYNPFHLTAGDSLSTFAIDVDNGSYTLARKKINQGLAPDPASIRVEEFLNYFDQEYLPPEDGALAVYLDGAPSPFRDSVTLLRVGIKGKEIASQHRKQWNLTFLVDISGSMHSRLGNVKNALNVLVDNMEAGDKISLCTYAGGVNTLITPTTLDSKEEIKDAINSLESGGSTAMASGIRNAYTINRMGYIEGGVNRVIVCSDGDDNVGATSHEAILELIASYVDEGVTLSTLGFGQGNYNDRLMEQLADNGNGNYYYIDSQEEAERLFSEDLASIMQMVAKDVKLQIAFSSQAILKYRLIGYEDRGIPDEDYEKEDTDAGELGSGHRVTALYELVMTRSSAARLGTVSLSYKDPESGESFPMEIPICRKALYQEFANAPDRFKFSVGVTEFAEILRESPFVEGHNLPAVESLIASSLEPGNAKDEELLSLVKRVGE